MAPGNVRTVPPWVVQQPRPSLPPQHNHAPSERRHPPSEPEILPGAVGNGSASNGNGKGAAPDGASVTDGAITVDGAPDTVATAGQQESAGTGLGHRLSHIFRRKEGRKWDHLRSAEPVIVPQFHVVNGPAVVGQDKHFSPTQRMASWRSEVHDGAKDAARHDPVSLRTATSSGANTNPAATPSAPTARTAPSRAGPSSSATSHHSREPSSIDRTSHPSWWYNPETQWRSFIETTRYPHLPNEKSEIIDDEEMARLNPDFGYNSTLPPRAGGGDGGGGVGHLHHKHHRPSYMADKGFYERIWQTLLHHPLGPLACRLTVLTTSILALIIAITIFRRENLGNLDSLRNGSRALEDFSSVWLADQQQERSQVIVAIIVDVVAIPYIGYITVDDYTGKPLGLRPVHARIRLILTDLFFIIFKSASTALGFEAMIYFNAESGQGLLRALAAFELIGLFSWTLTLTINIFREIERLGGGS